MNTTPGVYIGGEKGKGKRPIDETDADDTTIRASPLCKAIKTEDFGPKFATLESTEFYHDYEEMEGQHCIPLKEWDEYIEASEMSQTWHHKLFSSMRNEKSKEERRTHVAFICCRTGLRPEEYFLCIPVTRRLGTMPRNPRDASSNLLKTIKYFLVKGLFEPEKQKIRLNQTKWLRQERVNGSYAVLEPKNNQASGSGNDNAPPSNPPTSNKSKEKEASMEQTQPVHVPPKRVLKSIWSAKPRVFRPPLTIVICMQTGVSTTTTLLNCPYQEYVVAKVFEKVLLTAHSNLKWPN